MEHHDQIKALVPDLINGKTHEDLKNEVLLADKYTGSHCVNGVRFPGVVPRSNLDAIQTFEVRDDDVFLISYPRSGTHWMAEILQFIRNDGRDDFPRYFMTTGLELTTASDPSQADGSTPGYKIYEAMKSPRLICSHCTERLLPPQVWSTQAKVVYQARNPKDMLVSFFNLAKSVLPPGASPNFDEILWQFYFGEMHYGSWFDHVLGYWKHRDNANVLFMKYEDLQKDLRGSICKVAKHIGKDLPNDVIDRIEERVTFSGMQTTYGKLESVYGDKAKEMTHCFGNEAAPYLRKGKVGGWRNTFTVAQNTIFDQVYALKMQGSGLKFDFDL